MNGRVAVSIALIGIGVSGCGSTQQAQRAESGSERSAPELMRQYGCPTCHVIPHVPGAVGKVGPSLASVNQRLQALCRTRRRTCTTGSCIRSITSPALPCRRWASPIRTQPA